MKKFFEVFIFIADKIARPVDLFGAKMFRKGSKRLMWITGLPAKTLSFLGMLIGMCGSFADFILDGQFVVAGVYTGLMLYVLNIWNRMFERVADWLENASETIPVEIAIDLMAIMIYRAVQLWVLLMVLFPPRPDPGQAVLQIITLICVYTLGLQGPKRSLPSIVKDKIADLRARPILAPVPMS